MSRRPLALAQVLILSLAALLPPVLASLSGDGEGGPPAQAPGVATPGGFPSSPAPCTLHPEPSSARGRATGIAIWHPETVLRAGSPLNAVAAGDVVADIPGNETFAVDASGRLWMAWREDYAWRSGVLWNTSGNLTSLALSELDGASDGPELALGAALANGTGAVFVVSGAGGRASARQVLASSAPVLAVAAGDVLAEVAGTELVVLDGGGNLSVVLPGAPAGGPKNILRLPGATCLLVADLDDSTPGGEVAAGTSTGEVLELFWDGLAWQERGIWAAPSAISALAFGEADPLHEGPELALATGGGEVTVLARLDDDWSGRTVWSSAGAVPALAIGDADADAPGNELVAACPDNITRLRWDGSAWDRAVLWERSGPSGRLLVSEVDADHAGNEALVAGQDGILSSLGLYHPGFALTAIDARLTLAGGESAAFGLRLTPFDKLGGNVTLTVGTLPAGIAVAGSPGPVALAPPNVSATLELSVAASVANGERRFLVTATHPAGLFDSVWLSLVLERTLDLNLFLAARSAQAQPGSAAVYTVTLENSGTVNDSYLLEARVEGGWAVHFPAGNSTGKLAPGQNRSLELRVMVPGDAGGRTVKLSVNASSVASPTVSKTASMRLVVPQKGAPCGLILLPAGLVGTAFMLGRTGNKKEEN
ncbi:MAG: hypothetical protein FJ149_10980 [Euryarchaeota archaeon]|nr:hypothetical protein [Euryarchaeota archaeon]